MKASPQVRGNKAATLTSRAEHKVGVRDGYVTDRTSISGLQPTQLLICTASCHSTQLLTVSLLQLSFFSLCPTFSDLFILLASF